MIDGRKLAKRWLSHNTWLVPNGNTYVTDRLENFGPKYMCRSRKNCFEKYEWDLYRPLLDTTRSTSDR